MNVLILALAYGHLALAEDKPVKIHTSHFVDQELEKRVALDEKGQAAVRAWIESANCHYGSLDFPRRPKAVGTPEIFKMGADCSTPDAKAEVVSYCGAAVVCENRNARFLVRDVFCKATSARTCPPAQECALATNLTRSMTDRLSTHLGKQAGLFRQDMRGWDPGDTNRYPWTAMNEREMDEWERNHISNDTRTKGDEYPEETKTKGDGE